MAFLNALSVTAPTGLWHTILFWLEGLVNNYAVAIILLTVGVRLLMVPFDFANKYSGKKNSRLQNKMKPELDKINQKYAGQKDIINIKTQEVYKRYKFNVGGMCFTMLIPMILSMVIFTSIFAALGSVSKYEISKQFLQARKEYYQVYEIDVDTLAEGESALGKLNEKLITMGDTEKETKKAEADAKALATFNDSKDSFLWIDNIWLSDTPWTDPVLSYEGFIKNSEIEENALTEEEYEMIISNVRANTRNANGYLIIVVLSVATSYLSTAINGWITKAKAKKKGLQMNQVGLGNKGKIAMWFLPVLIGVIILFYNAAFAIYSTMGSVVLLVTNPIMTLFIDMLEFEAIEKEEDKTMAPYDRKRK